MEATKEQTGKSKAYRWESKVKNLDSRIYKFLFFLFISSVLWFFNALSKEYVTELKLPVTYKGIPLEYKATQALPNYFIITISGSGSTILSYKTWNTPNFELDLTPYFIGQNLNNDFSTQILSQLSRSNIERLFNNALTVKEISPSVISITFSRLKTKKVKVYFGGKVKFEPQYWLKTEPQLVPDSIEVAGPGAIIDTLCCIFTNDTILKNIKAPVTTNIGLNNRGVLNLSQKMVSITIIPEKFTENTLSVPITILNRPQNAQVILFPDHVMVKYQVGIDDFERITSTGFTAIVNFYSLQQAGTGKKAKVELVETHPLARNVSVSPREVSYIINWK